MTFEKVDIAEILPTAPQPRWPGHAVAIVKGGEVVQRECAGLASVEHGVPIGPDTVFRIASITKQFLCAGLVALADDGKLDLDAPLAEHLAIHPAAAGVTIRQAMANTSGIRDHLELWYIAGGGLQVPHRARESLKLSLKQPALNFTPGTRFLYSNANFLILSQIVEQVVGQPLGDYLSERFFTPLGMTRTHLRGGHHEVVEDLATGYVVSADGTLTRGRMTAELWGEGAAHSCLNDLIKWVGYYRADPDGIIAQMKEPLALENGESPYGLGLYAENWRGMAGIGHNGLWPGYLTEVSYFPDEDTGIVTLANVNSIWPTLVNRRIAERLFADRLASAERFAPDPESWKASHETGLWINPETLDIAEFGLDEDGGLVLQTYGFDTALSAMTATRFAPDFGRSDIAVIDITEAARGQVTFELANGTTLPLRPASKGVGEGAEADFVGRWWCDDIDSLLIIRKSKAGFEVETPGFRGHDWVASTRPGGLLQIDENTGPWPRRFFLFLASRSELILNGPRVRRLAFRRMDSEDGA